MATTVIGMRPWYDCEDISDVMLDILPRFVQNAEIDAYSVTGKVSDVRAHRLYERVGYASFDEYAAAVLNKPVDWFDRVAAVTGRIGKTLADERLHQAEIIQSNTDKTNAELAEQLGVSVPTVVRRKRMIKNPVLTKSLIIPRQWVRVQINSGTKPETAAEKIHSTFGPDFAQALKAAL